MRYTFLFIITLIIVSGFIAYFGDFLGRKMGKKRLTLFGLRPRYTAIFVTTITGMVIAFLTMVTIISVSTSIRTVIIAGEQQIAQNKHLRKDNKHLTDINRRLQEKEQRFRRDYEEAKKARDAAVVKVEGLSKLIEAARLELNDVRKKKNLTEAQLADKERALEKLENELLAMQSELAATNDKLAKAQKNLAAAERELAEAERITAYQFRTIESQKREIADQNAELEELQRQKRIAEVGYGSLRLKNLILQQGQELTRRVVSQNQPVSAIREEIVSLLFEASREAKEAGAGVSENGRAVMVVPPTPDRDENWCISTVADLISKSPTPVIVQVVVWGNTMKDEPALVHLQMYKNHLAFEKGKLLASRGIDGRLPEGKILLSVIDFLRKDVRRAADAADVVPIASPEPEIQGDQLDELMDLVSKIKSINAPVKLKVSAEKDIYAAGPLNLTNLEFSISTLVDRTSRANAR